MKKIFLGFALLASTFAFSQNTVASSAPVRFGAKAGLNISSLSDSDLSSKSDFYAGVFANIPIAKDFSINPEVLYSGMGAKDELPNKLNLNYIAIPVLFQYNVLPNLYLEAGPQFSFLMNAKIKSKQISLDIKDNIKTFDFGIGLGTGYYFTQNIGANLRYVAGLTDVAKNKNTIEGNKSFRNGVFQVGLSYKF